LHIIPTLLTETFRNQISPPTRNSGMKCPLITEYSTLTVSTRVSYAKTRLGIAYSDRSDTREWQSGIARSNGYIANPRIHRLQGGRPRSRNPTQLYLDSVC
jgi:hypothetical protein